MHDASKKGMSTVVSSDGPRVGPDVSVRSVDVASRAEAFGPPSAGPLSSAPLSQDAADSVAYAPPRVASSLPPPYRRAPRFPSGAVELAGDLVGSLVAPLFFLASRLRRARTFHPRGDVGTARVEVDPIASGTARRVAERLRGVALVRFSSALDKGGDGTEGRKLLRFDVLGCAMRFAYREGQELEGDQDLLFATIRRPWTMPFAPFTTRVGATLGNDYFTVSPFSVPGEPTCYFRLRPERDVAKDAREPRPARTREERRAALARRIADGTAVLYLEVGEGPFGPWERGARVRVRTLREDVPTLRFDPYRCGRGLRPKGFVHALRRAVYAASQAARATARAARAPGRGALA